MKVCLNLLFCYLDDYCSIFVCCTWHRVVGLLQIMISVNVTEISLGFVICVLCIDSIVNFLVVPADNTGTVENQVSDEPQASRFTWMIENFSRLNTKKLYSDVFIVGGYKW